MQVFGLQDMYPSLIQLVYAMKELDWWPRLQTQKQADRQIDFAAQAHSPQNTGKAL